MKVLLDGWKRCTGGHQLVACDVSNAGLHNESDGWGRGMLEDGVIRAVGLEQGEPTGLEIVAYAHNVMGSRGNFALTVRLTKGEIANLAKIAFGRDQFSEVISLLSKREAEGRERGTAL